MAWGYAKATARAAFSVADKHDELARKENSEPGKDHSEKERDAGIQAGGEDGRMGFLRRFVDEGGVGGEGTHEARPGKQLEAAHMDRDVAHCPHTAVDHSKAEGADEVSEHSTQGDGGTQMREG